jgi:hypothetical protein
MPELVLAEAEAAWQRKIAETIKNAKKAVSELERRLAAYFSAEDLLWPSPDASAKYYHTALAEIEGMWRWTVAPIPATSLQATVLSAARHEPPFADGDTGFRDSVILLSLLDQLSEGDVLGLVSEDTRFIKGRISGVEWKKGVTVKVLESAEVAKGVVAALATASQSAELIATWNARRAQLVSSVNADYPRLERFIRHNIEIPEYPYGSDGRVVTVRDIKIGQAESAELPLLGSGPSEGTVHVPLKVEVILERYAESVRRPMRIGQSSADANPVRGTGTTGIAEIDALAVIKVAIEWPLGQDDNPEILSYTGMEFSTPEHQKMLHDAIVDALGRG